MEDNSTKSKGSHQYKLNPLEEYWNEVDGPIKRQVSLIKDLLDRFIVLTDTHAWK